MPTLSRTLRQGSKRELLEHHGDAAGAQVAQGRGVAGRDVDAAAAMLDQHLAARHPVQPVDGAEQGRFARTREAHQDADLARCHRQAGARDAEHVAGRGQDLVAAMAGVEHRERALRRRPEHDVDVAERDGAAGSAHRAAP